MRLTKRNETASRVGRALARALAACALLPGGLAAAEPGLVSELKLGVLAHDVDGLWSGFSLEDGIDVNLELVLSPAVHVLGGALRPAIGASVNTAGDTSKAYADARLEYGRNTGPFIAFGLGAAVHDGRLDPDRVDRKALGSRVLFHIPLEAGIRFDGGNSLAVYFDHMSNAELADPNEGLDTLGLRYGRRF